MPPQQMIGKPNRPTVRLTRIAPIILLAALCPSALLVSAQSPPTPAAKTIAPLPLTELPAQPTNITPDLNHLYTLASPVPIYHPPADNPGPANAPLGGAWSMANEFVFRTALRNQFQLPSSNCSPCADGYHIDFTPLDGTTELHVLVSNDQRQIQVLPDPLLVFVKHALATPIVSKRPDGSADQQPTGLNFDPILISTWQDKDVAEFPADKRKAKSALNKLADDKKVWALCALLDNPDIDLRIDAASSLQFIGYPESAPALLAAAKANNYAVSGSDNATLHANYRAYLRGALETTTGLSLTPRNLRKQYDSTDPKQPAFISSNDHPESFPQEIDFAKADAWLRARFLQPTVTELKQLLGQPFDAPAVKEFAAAHDLKHYFKFDSGGYENPEFLPVSLVYSENQICRITITSKNVDAVTDPPFPNVAQYTQPVPYNLLELGSRDKIIERLGPPTTTTADTLTYKNLNITLTFSPESHNLYQLDFDAPGRDRGTLP